MIYAACWILWYTLCLWLIWMLSVFQQLCMILFSLSVSQWNRMTGFLGPGVEMDSFWWFIPFDNDDRCGVLVVRASALLVGDRELDTLSPQTKDSKIVTDATSLGAQHLQDKTSTGWPDVNIIWLGGVYISMFSYFAVQYSSEEALRRNTRTISHKQIFHWQKSVFQNFGIVF